MSDSKSKRFSGFFEALLAQEVDDQFLEKVRRFLEEQIAQSEEKKRPINLNDIRSKDYKTLLHIAVSKGFEKSVDFVLSQGADVQGVDENGLTVLHHLAMGKDNLDKGKRFSEALLRHGANINAGDEHGNSPLWLAANDGNLAMVQFLLDKGANVDKGNKMNDSPLHAALKGKSKNTEEIVRLLLDHDASLVQRNTDCHTPVHTAIEKRVPCNVVKALLAKSTDVLKPDSKNDQTPLELAQWLNPECSHDVLDLLKNPEALLAQTAAATSTRTTQRTQQQANPLMGAKVASDNILQDIASVVQDTASNGDQRVAISLNLNFKNSVAAIGTNSSVALIDPSSPEGLQFVPLTRLLPATRCPSRPNTPQGDSENPLPSTGSSEYNVNISGSGATAVGDRARIDINRSLSTCSRSTSGTLSSQTSVECDESASAGASSPRSGTPPSPNQVERT